MNPTDISQKIRNFVRFKLVEVDPNSGGQDTEDRQVIIALAVAWADAVRDEWQNWIKANPLLQDAYAVALVLMREDGYDEHLGDPVCGLPGVEAMVANVDGRKCVCYERSIGNAPRRKRSMKPPRFNRNDAQKASDTWHCNCGPSALAAISGLTLDEVRPHMGDFEHKGYTNPTLMVDSLKRVGVKFHVRRFTDERYCDLDWPRYGLARIQWEGPWTNPGVPIRARYRHTHWVGASIRDRDAAVGIFDINAMGNGTGWCSLDNWRNVIVPWILKECVPRAAGGWYLTHAIEVHR